MSDRYPNIFSPLRIGKVEISNRTAMMAMGVFSPRLMNLKIGAYTKDGADYYIERAKGGAGLIITGLIGVLPGMPIFNPLLHPEDFVKEMRYLTDGVHAENSKIFVQLTAMNGRAALIENEDEWKLFCAPAPIQNVWNPELKNRGMSLEEIKQTVKNFGKAAFLVKEAGGDGVEIHAVHEGYLLDQFAISFYNYRQDEYGGSLENRLRFAKEIVEEIKKTCGEDFPVSLRYSVRSYVKDFNRGALPGEDFEEKGRNIEESIEAAKLLENYGYDMLNCDNGSYDSWYWSHPPVYMPKSCNLDDVAVIKKAVNIPVVCAGRFDEPETAENAIKDGIIDVMGMGRAFLADPQFVNKLKEGRAEDIRPCIACHQGCLGRIFQGKDISCAVNPACGREKSYTIEPAGIKKKVLVVGGGLGGMETARVCALRGHDVDLYEKTGDLGGVFVAAATPDFKDDDKNLLAWYKKQMEDLPINVHMNEKATEDTVKGYDEIVIATGAKERYLDVPGFDEKHVTYALEALKNEDIQGENIIIIGGGLTGCEIAYMLGRQGKKVTIVEMSETILNAFGLSAANYNMLMELLDYHKVRVIKNAVVEEYKDGTAKIKETIKNYPNSADRAARFYALGPKGEIKHHEIPADHIVVSVGYIPDNDLYNSIKSDKVHVIGDARQPSNVMGAIWEAYDLAREI